MKAINHIVGVLTLRINEKNRYYVLSIVLMAILLFDYFVIMARQFDTIKKLTPQIQTLSHSLKEAKDNMAHLDQFQKEINQHREKMRGIGTTILTREEIPIILDHISNIANQYQIKINQMMPLKDAQQEILSNSDGKYYSLPVLINAKGGYHNIGRFFNDLENNKIFMSIIDFDLVSSVDDPTRHTITMKIKTFIQDKTENKDVK